MASKTAHQFVHVHTPLCARKLNQMHKIWRKWPFFYFFTPQNFFPKKIWKFFLFYFWFRTSWVRWCNHISSKSINNFILRQQHTHEVLNRKEKISKFWPQKVQKLPFSSYFIHFIQFSRAQRRAHMHESVRTFQNHVTYIFFYLTHILSTS